MDNLTIAVWGLVATLLGCLVAWFFKTPKEVNADMDRRVRNVEDRLTTLSLRYEGTNGRTTHALETLTESINRLTTRFDNWMGKNGNRD